MNGAQISRESKRQVKKSSCKHLFFRLSLDRITGKQKVTAFPVADYSARIATAVAWVLCELTAK